MKADPAQTLRQMCWRDPPPAFLERVLAEALQEAAVPRRKFHVLGWIAFIPRPLRLPLAACWLLAFFFHITTPEVVPHAVGRCAKLPSVTPAQLLANLKQIEQLADELLHLQHHGAIPPL